MRTCQIVDFAVPPDHRLQLKENEKKDKYLDLARELEKLWNIKVTVIPIIIGTLGAVTIGFIKGTGGLGNRRKSRCNIMAEGFRFIYLAFGFS